MAVGNAPLDNLNLGTQNNTRSVTDFTDSQLSLDTGAKLDGKQTTTFTKVKIDPATLIVNPNAVTYTANTGYLVVIGVRNDQAGPPPSLTLGSAGQRRPEDAALTATATLDLSSTRLSSTPPRPASSVVAGISGKYGVDG